MLSATAPRPTRWWQRKRRDGCKADLLKLVQSRTCGLRCVWDKRIAKFTEEPIAPWHVKLKHAVLVLFLQLGQSIADVDLKDPAHRDEAIVIIINECAIQAGPTTSQHIATDELFRG